MSEKEDAERSAWLESVKKDFASDPDALAALDKVFTHPAATERFYRGTLRQDEFHRRLNETHAMKTELEQQRLQVLEAAQQVQNYYATEGPKNEALLKHKQVLEAEKAALEAALLARGEEPRSILRQPQEPPVSAGSQALQNEVEALKQQLATITNTLPVYLNDSIQATYEIVKNGWDVDPRAVLDYSLTRGVRASEALQQLTAKQRQDRQESEIQKRIDEAKEQAKRELMAAHPTSDFTRATPRFHRVEDMQKAMDALGNRESRRDAAIAETRKLWDQGVRD
jgi:hypothetical protein